MEFTAEVVREINTADAHAHFETKRGFIAAFGHESNEIFFIDEESDFCRGQ